MPVTADLSNANIDKSFLIENNDYGQGGPSLSDEYREFVRSFDRTEEFDDFIEFAAERLTTQNIAMAIVRGREDDVVKAIPERTASTALMTLASSAGVGAVGQKHWAYS